MPAANPTLSAIQHPCVVGVQHPEFCNKIFPSIEKHNEHLKRCHSLVYWCEKCLHKFNCSLPEKNIKLEKAEHEKEDCPGQPSQENKKLMSDTWVMDQEQYGRFTARKWKKTPIPDLPNGETETRPQKSWRQIQKTLFPCPNVGIMERNIEPVASDGTTRDTVADQETPFPSTDDIELNGGPVEYGRTLGDIVEERENKPPGLMGEIITQFSHDYAYATQPARIDAVPPSQADASQPETVFSEETNSQTDPTSIAQSQAEKDFGDDCLGDYLHLELFDGDQGQQSSGSVSGAGGWSFT